MSTPLFQLYKSKFPPPIQDLQQIMNYQRIDRQYTYKEQDPTYMGEPLDRELADGPNEQRKFRDCLCLLLYAALWAALIVIGSYAWTHGNPGLLAAPFDSTGRQCGLNDAVDYPFAYYSLKNLSQFGCVRECPGSESQQFQTMLGGALYGNSEFPAYQTLRIVSICLPVSQQISKYISSGLGYFDKAVSDLKASWKITVVGMVAAVVLSVVLLAFVRACGSCIVLLTIVVYLAGLVGLGAACMVVSSDGIQGLEDWTNPDVLRAAAYLCWALAAISLIALCCSIKKLRIATAVIKSAAEFTRQQCKVLLVPVVMCLAICGFLVFWVLASVYIFSCGQVRQCGKSPYACIEWEVGAKRSLGLFLFALFWNCEVAIAVCQFVIASTAAYWYFSKARGTAFPLARSFCRALTYQLGSLLFGALILCIMSLLQILLQLMHHFAKNPTISSAPATNFCADYFIRCSRCCLACFQRFVRFITKNAFLMMAISGEGFCTSAHQAFYLAMRSSAEYSITHGVGHALMLFSKLLVSVLVTLLAYVLVVGLEEFKEAVYSPLTPAIMSFIASYVIGSFFMDVFAVASDTILLCYCLELDIRKGQAIVCPQSLKGIIAVGSK